MAQFTDCLIIGAGQAGLAMSQCLGAHGVEHTVLERGTIANRWTSMRWPSLRLLTPGWMTRMPGQTLAGAEDGFLSAADLAGRLTSYGREQSLPIIEGVDVLALEAHGERFRAVTSQGTWIARSVVIATGACDRPRIPHWGHKLSRTIHQIASTQYRGAGELPEGGVLVIGASATGIQLAAELAESGRNTFLAAGSHVRTPRRYRGRDMFEWLDICGFLGDQTPANSTPAQLMTQPSHQLIGSDDNKDINLFDLARKGVTITGHAHSADGEIVTFADDLLPMLDMAEDRRRRLLGRIDKHIARHCLDVPVDEAAWANPGMLLPFTGAINLKAHGISTVLWATGYRRDYSWLHLDACDASGELRQTGGICDVPGIYALGLPMMRHRASSFIDGVGRDAEALAPIISARLGQTHRLAVA